MTNPLAIRIAKLKKTSVPLFFDYYIFETTIPIIFFATSRIAECIGKVCNFAAVVHNTGKIRSTGDNLKMCVCAFSNIMGIIFSA